MKLRNTLPAGDRRKRRGGVLVLSLVAVGVVASLSVAYLRLAASVSRRQVGASDTKLAFYLAEAGLAEAYSGILIGRTGNVAAGDAPAVLGEGLLWVEATALDDDHVQLESVGMARSGQARLGMVIRRGKENLGGLGIFSEQDISVGDGSRIDGYNSLLGDYHTQAAETPVAVKRGSLGSNGNVTITSDRLGTSVFGLVTTGPTGTLILEGTPTIAGQTQTASSLVVLDPPEPPPTTIYPGVVQPAGAPFVVPSGTFGAQYLVLATDAEVVLQGPLTLVLGGLQVSAGAELTFDTTNGEIELFVANALDLVQGGFVTCTEEDSTRTTVNVVGDADVMLAGTSEFYGLVYAPEATVNVGAGFELFGGLVAENLALGSGVSLHHDRALIAAGAQEALPKLLSWRILELPENSRDTVNVDPFALLGVDPAACPRPADAHQDQPVSVIYFDDTATKRTYDGMESGFDWGGVRKVVSTIRVGGLVEDDVVMLARMGSLGLRRLIP